MPGTGTPLVISVRKQGAEYHQEVVANLGGANYDANDSTLPPHELRLCNNFRVNTRGDLEVRPGYKEYPAPGLTGETGDPLSLAPLIPLGKMEFVVLKTDPLTGAQSSYSYDLTAVFIKLAGGTSGYVGVIAIDKNPVPDAMPPAGLNGFFCPGATFGWFAAPPIVDMCEYNGSVYVTVYDDPIGDVGSPHPHGGVYQSYPQGIPILPSTPWTTRKIGKDLCPVPLAYTFPDTVKGSLFVYQAKQTNGNMTIVNDSTGAQATIEVKMDAQYWKSSNPTVEYMKERLFVLNANADPFQNQHVDKHLKYHPPARGYGYRFVARRRIKDARGNDFEFNSAPSVDMWVEDVIFCPPVLGMPLAHPTDKIEFISQIYGKDSSLIDTALTDGQSGWRDQAKGERYDVTAAPKPFIVKGAGGSNGDAQGYPTNADYLALRDMYRNCALSQVQDLTADPFFFAAAWLGWWVNFDANFLNGQPPYMVAVPASKLKGCPLTIFDWQDFVRAGLPSDVTEIDIYRTAHTLPNEKDNTTFTGSGQSGELLFGPNLYGYVGTLKAPITAGAVSTFQDTIPDTQLQFGKSPTDDDGSLEGQFVGQVMIEYNQKLVLGNTRTSYWVNSPWQLHLPFINSYADPQIPYGNYDPDTQFIPAPDGLNLLAWCYTYLDKFGNESAPTDIQINAADTQHSPHTNVTFVFGRGYNPIITTINLYESRWDPVANVRRYALVDTIDVSANMDSRTGPRYPNPADYPLSRPVRTVKDYYGPGDVIWSDRNQPFVWPEMNTEVHSQLYAVNGFRSILGELFVFTGGSTTLTKLSNDEPIRRLEEENKDVGCIARNALAKYSQVVFFLSPKGMYFAQGSGIINYPAKAWGPVREYLEEVIPGQPPLANASRATLALLERRQEMWLYFPSSIDFWTAAGHPENALPQMLMIYKFIDGEIGSFYRNTDIRSMQNWTFDLHKDFQIVNFSTLNPTIDYTKFRPEKVYFCQESDGTLWASYYDQSTGNQNSGKLITLNCDDPTVDWPGLAQIEKPIVLGMPQTPKYLRRISLKVQADASLTITTGIQKLNGVADAVRGNVDQRATIWPFTILRPNRPDSLSHIPPGNAYENKGYAPTIRFVSAPNPNSTSPDGITHKCVLEGIDVYVALENHHP